MESTTGFRPHSHTHGAGYGEAEASFDQVRRAERYYGIQLRKIARHVGDIITAFEVGSPQADALIRRAMERYAELLQPWAQATAAGMLADVTRRDAKVWRNITEGMGSTMRDYIRSAPLAPVLAELEGEQVRLITSLPLEAAERVHKLMVEGLYNATRASEIAKEIMRSGEVTESRANLIARTEVGRASGKITETRALHVGSEGYIWRTVGDADVRHDHRLLNGKFIRYDSPPIADKKSGTRAHAGCIWNCRCYQEPVIPQLYRA